MSKDGQSKYEYYVMVFFNEYHIIKKFVYFES